MEYPEICIAFSEMLEETNDHSGNELFHAVFMECNVEKAKKAFAQWVKREENNGL